MIRRNVLPLSSVEGYLSWAVVAVYSVQLIFLPKHGRALPQMNCVLCIYPAVHLPDFTESSQEYEQNILHAKKIFFRNKNISKKPKLILKNTILDRTTNINTNIKIIRHNF
jgi:hypothetical protein